MWGRTRAWILLALAWLTMSSSRLLGIGRRYGLPAFNRNYAADRIQVLASEQRRVLLGASRCIACARCEQGDAPLRADPGYPGLMTLVLAGSRNQPDFPEAARAWALIPRDELERRERRCPTGVPIAALGDVVRALGRQD